MLFDEIRQYLSEDERAAIDFLEERGFIVVTDARLEDCRQKDGKRFRTFSLSGRYNLMIGLKSIEGRTAIEVSEPDSEELGQESDENGSNEIGIDAILETQQEKAEVFGDNFWMSRDGWIRMNRDVFYQTVCEDQLEDLESAPIDVQEEVKEKFLRFFTVKDWPL